MDKVQAVEEQWESEAKERKAKVDRIAGFVDAVLSGSMVKIREIRGARLRDPEPRDWMSCDRHQAVLYDHGVQFESDGGATLFGWDSIEVIYV